MVGLTYIVIKTTGVNCKPQTSLWKTWLQALLTTIQATSATFCMNLALLLGGQRMNKVNRGEIGRHKILALALFCRHLRLICWLLREWMQVFYFKVWPGIENFTSSLMHFKLKIKSVFNSQNKSDFYPQNISQMIKKIAFKNRKTKWEHSIKILTIGHYG